MCRKLSSCNANNTNNKLGCNHTDGAPDKKGSATPFIHGVECKRGGQRIDKSAKDRD